ncbi:VOC family protein [Ramlibacter pallidus]|uniref:VOC family protein n=1 Tax=Ramlibacter pallidus TaxID=2780087 RepID=A0ABR9S4X6_9BURK|nr:VOC family protein [Ramlibacter pallidus]MBE7368561.1 VOC family protein [Ramlibacter pallidus]
MPDLDSYLFFNGNCAEAMRFYERTFGGQLEPLLKYGDRPEEPGCAGGAPAPDLVMHACLKLGGRMLMASDMPPGQGQATPGAFALALNYPTAQEARRIFDALSQGGSVTMPMGKTFWAEAFGMLTDRFGVPWMVGGGAQAA